MNGKKTRNPWTQEELDILRKHNNMTAEELSRLIPTHPARSIQARRLQEGFRKQKRHDPLPPIVPGQYITEYLIAVRREIDTKNSNEARWVCNCTRCGRTSTHREKNLRGGRMVSCGCLRRDITKTGLLTARLGTVDGTRLNILNDTPNRNNSTSAKGVYRRSNGKYVAHIMYKGNRKYLGTFDEIDEAIKARRKAEAEIFPELLKIGNMQKEKIMDLSHRVYSEKKKDGES